MLFRSNGSNGALDAGVKIQVSTNGLSWFDASPTSATTWTYDDRGTSRSGNVTYRARVIDAYGNVGKSALQLVSIDTTPPSVTMTSVGGEDGILSSAAGDTLVVGTAEANRSVSLFRGDTTNPSSLLGTTSTDASGNFAYTLSAANITAIGQGSNRSITASQTDLAGNTGSTGFYFAIDTVAPNAPTITTVAADNIINGTEKATGFSLSGKAEANSMITISWGGFSRTANSDGSGNWSLGYSSGFIPADGTSTISVTATDGAGNASSATSRSVLIDTAAPLAPTLATVAGDDRVNASERTPGITLTGMAEANSSIAISWGGVSRATTASASGAWSLLYNPSSIPSDNTNSLISVTASDSAGNTSVAASRTLLIDSVAPSAPSINTVAGDNVINAAEKSIGFAISGTGEANSTITINWGGFSRTTTADGSGSWSLSYANTLVPADSASSAISVTASDLAGNVSSAASRGVVIDTIAPNAPGKIGRAHV